MKLAHILNKFIAVIAGIIAIGYLLPMGDDGLSLWEILFGLAWLFGAIFTWKKQAWASILLMLLAIFNLIFDIILEIPNFRTTMDDLSREIELPISIIQTLGVIVISFETIILLCVIYYGVIVISGNRGD